MLICLLSEIAG